MATMLQAPREPSRCGTERWTRRSGLSRAIKRQHSTFGNFQQRSLQVQVPSTEIEAAYGLAGLLIVIAIGLGLLAIAVWRRPSRTIAAPAAWGQLRFGFPIYALIFLAFDMEMIFMYPWAVVFADLGIAAFIDMMVFIALLSAGIAYAWGMGGLEWE